VSRPLLAAELAVEGGRAPRSLRSLVRPPLNGSIVRQTSELREPDLARRECRMALRILIALGLSVVLVTEAGCSSKQCTLIGCGPPFEVDFRPIGGPWSPGKYTISVTADGITGACEITLPSASCQDSPAECTSNRDWDVLGFGCALPPEQHSISGIVFGRTTPGRVDVAVSGDVSQPAEATFVPGYETTQPNGPGCGDTCFGAPAATMSIQL